MLIAISIFEAFILISMSEKLTEATLKNIIDESSMKNAELYSEIIGNWFKERMKEIEVYANCPVVSTMNWELTKQYLQDEIKGKLDIYDHFLVADIDGNYNTTLEYSNSIKDREYFKAAMSGKVVVSDPIISKATGHQIAVVAAPIRDSSGKIVGVLGGTINLIKLSRIIESLKYSYPNSYSYIVDKNGLVIAHPDENYIMKVNITKKSDIISESIMKSASQILNNKSGSILYTFNSITSLNYFQEIPNTDGWKLIVKIPTDYWQKPIRYASINLAEIGIAGFIIAAIMGLLVSKSISKPIINLKNVFRKAALGDLTVRSDIDTSDEIGEAAKNFNKMMNTISRLTYYDPLTDLPNKLMFNDRLRLELGRAASEKMKLAIMIFDIDKFENINDTLGHDAGDKLLKCIANKVSSILGETEMISRMGEDKFAIMFTGIDHEKNVIKTAQEILELIKQPWIVDEYSFYITACIGIAFFPEDAGDSDSLFKNAYSAMLRAKKTGRDNYMLYDPSVNFRLIEQLNLDNSMHHALENGEFSIHYQPQVDTVSKEIIGCEALLRWNHPELGMVSPAKFIPIAEANGLMIPIGEWVLRNACAQNKCWQEAGYKPIRVSVNISAVQLLQENFIDLIANVLKETKLHPDYLELEITESIAMENSEYIPPILDELNGMGIRIALDDFGTGYSSLNYLKNFPISNLKIDQSFVRDVAGNPKNAAIISTILAIGHNLQLRVTAEGVETEEQYDMLKKESCDIIQGYLFGKPLPSNEFEKLLIDTKKAC